MYPLCPYQAAWKPGSPEGTLAGGGMPGPTLEVHGVVSELGVTGCSVARAAPASAGATPSRIAAHVATSALLGVIELSLSDLLLRDGSEVEDHDGVVAEVVIGESGTFDDAHVERFL
jgi:hypothetical protein